MGGPERPRARWGDPEPARPHGEGLLPALKEPRRCTEEPAGSPCPKGRPIPVAMLGSPPALGAESPTAPITCSTACESSRRPTPSSARDGPSRALRRRLGPRPRRLANVQRSRRTRLTPRTRARPAEPPIDVREELRVLPCRRPYWPSASCSPWIARAAAGIPIQIVDHKVLDHGSMKPTEHVLGLPSTTRTVRSCSRGRSSRDSSNVTLSSPSPGHSGRGTGTAASSLGTGNSGIGSSSSCATTPEATPRSSSSARTPSC